MTTITERKHMSREDIISMAREAGFEIGSVTNAIYAPTSCETELERFAALVALAEREKCAKLCESMRPSKREFDEKFFDTCSVNAALIREMGNPA